MNPQDNQSDSESTLEPLSASETLISRPVAANHALGIKSLEAFNQEQKKDQEIRLKFAEETHQYVREYIRLADQKATFFFAGATALLAYLNGLGMTNSWVIDPRTWRLIDALAFLATTGFIFSAIAFVSTILPRTNGSRRGLIFFAAIHEHENANEYASEIMKQNLQDLYEAKLMHTYDLSGICKKKYGLLKWGQWIGAGAVLSLMLLLILK